jgi:hypothetical protein
LLPRFQYAVFFTVSADRVHVLGILHLRRSPTTWRSRLRERATQGFAACLSSNTVTDPACGWTRSHG